MLILNIISPLEAKPQIEAVMAACEVSSYAIKRVEPAWYLRVDTHHASTEESAVQQALEALGFSLSSIPEQQFWQTRSTAF